MHLMKFAFLDSGLLTSYLILVGVQNRENQNRKIGNQNRKNQNVKILYKRPKRENSFILKNRL